MAPVEADVFNSNRDPLFHLISAAVLVDLCLVTVLKYISKAVRTLPPAQKTRAREEQRKKNVTTYGSLAIASVLILLYHWGYALLSSYEAWANEQGEPTPGALWDGWYAGTGDLDWQLGRWWQDVNPPDEFKRAALGSSRAVWWTQQLLIARLAFSAFVGIEGRRRDIPSWAIAALWGLAELSSLSLAQSLFFVILTITPYPATATQHGARWTPHVHVYLVPVGIASLSTGFLPGLTSNDAGWIADTGSRLSTLFLATGIKFLPKRFGKQHKDVHAAHHAETKVYNAPQHRVNCFYLRSTFWGVLLNSGPTYHRRYNFVWSTHPWYERTLWSKLTSASGKILGAISDDPIISVIGWDVLLSGFSLCIWAAARGLDVKDIDARKPYRVSRFSVHKASRKVKEERKLYAKGRTVTDGSDADDAAYTPSPTVEAEVADLEHEEEHDDTMTEDAEAAALAWGLSLVGGLGLMSAAVMGAEIRSRSGKSSISSVVFHKLPPSETLYLETTTRIKKESMHSFMDFQVWDFPGHLDYFDPAFDVDNIFDEIGALIWVIDAQDEYLDAITRLNTHHPQPSTLLPQHQTSRFLFTKSTVFSEDYKSDTLPRHLIQRVQDELSDAGYENAPVSFYQTSIYDHSIFEAFSKVIQKLIPQLPTLESLLKQPLFHLSKIYIATDTSPTDIGSYEICSDYIDVVVDNGHTDGDAEETGNNDAESLITMERKGNNYLYLREINKYLALICLMGEDSPAEKKALIDYNVGVFQEALAQVFPR
ncbi:hypothetical protein GTA08_BOTSDO11435 [Botryosphaeria dothidea]|uniref:Uncharacterized protein n=1 Tax=Botryosphaeria dothidea TaxID=55169 RepID=A0A8H4IHI3_9PEZI|nr:hypothetical protein GTA08_BOTSDO11435 [Botryosphaeria dothidea]